MPTINQLVRNGRTSAVEKSKAPALNKRWNSLTKKTISQNSAQKRGVCTRVGTMTPKNRIRRFGNTLVSVSATDLKSRLISAAKDTIFRNTARF